MARATIFPGVFLGVLAATSALAATPAQDTLTIANNTPKIASSAKTTSTVDPSSIMEVSIWLKPHNKPEMDALAKDLYDPASKNYRRFLSKSEFVSRFAPSAAEAKSVQEFFTANHLGIVKVGPDNFYVRARGSAAAVAAAFHTSFANYQVGAKTVRANTSDPAVSGAAAPLVASVSGLDTLEFTHPLDVRPSFGTTPGGSEKSESVTANLLPASDFNTNCFPGTRTEKLTSADGQVTATYKGNGYTGASEGCGYTPQNIRAAYNLNALYKEGYDGTGQTIVILDWCGSPTIRQDANAFSKQFGLPPLGDNFTITYTAPSYCEAPDAEINLDVEWAHAIAPGAAINLVVPPSASFQDIDQGLFYAIDYQLGNVISGSFGAEEYYLPASTLITEDLIAETAAVLGISANFSTGDSGDFTAGLPKIYPISVSAPADSPYATAIGGISLALKSDNSIAWQTGWGTNENLLAQDGLVEDPPIATRFFILGHQNGPHFIFGSGGGLSDFFGKPLYQEQLRGRGRHLPDISWLADPFTGAYVAISEGGAIPEIRYESIGGTSLSCPMFSALWAIANQEAGQPLGQAAPYLYTMPPSTITDVLPYSSPSNVTGSIYDGNGTSSYSALQLASPLNYPLSAGEGFVSALWDYPLEPSVTILLTFDTDSRLETTAGYDNVTGLGVPNGKAFADYFHP